MSGLLVIVIIASLVVLTSSFGLTSTMNRVSTRSMKMEVKNDAFTRANRETRKAGADDRMVELRKPMGMELDEDKEGNVFVKTIDKNGRADKSGVVFVGDYVAMVSATFGDDLWSCRGVGLTRVLSCIKVRNNKPVTLVFEAANEAEEKKRRAIAYKEATVEEKAAAQKKADGLMVDMLNDDKSLLKKRKGLFGLW
jgi:C-terminal processing protease CtpA/Prc